MSRSAFEPSQSKAEQHRRGRRNLLSTSFEAFTIRISGHTPLMMPSVRGGGLSRDREGHDVQCRSHEPQETMADSHDHSDSRRFSLDPKGQIRFAPASWIRKIQGADLAKRGKARDWLASDGVEALASESSNLEQLALVRSGVVKQSKSWASQGRQPLPSTLRDLGPQASQRPWHSLHPHFLWYPTR